MKPGKKIIFGAIGLLILLSFIFIKLGFYPVALTSKWTITSRQFNKVVASSLVYYQKLFPSMPQTRRLIMLNFKKKSNGRLWIN